jgi:hypothetical protein
MLYSGIAAVALLGMVVAVFALNGRVGLGLSTVARHPTPRPTARVVVGSPVGTLVYVDSQNGAVGHLDALKIHVRNLPALPANTQYDAWLINDQTHAITALGKLNGQGSSYTLDYQQPNTNLLALGNDLWITPEQGSVDTPSNRPVVIGVYPNGSYPIIRDMLVSFPNTPNQISLVSGLLDQAGRLSAQAQLLQASAGAGITARVQCAAQNIVDIIEGAGEQHYQAPTAFCVSRGFGDNGDGFGLLGSGGYLADVKGHAALIGSLPNATIYMHTHSVHVKIAVANIEGWVTTIEQDAINLVNNPNDPSKVAEVVRLADRTYHGVDLDGDESIDPVPGEAGAVTAYEHTQLMVSLDLAAPQSTP